MPARFVSDCYQIVRSRHSSNMYSQDIFTSNSLNLGLFTKFHRWKLLTLTLKTGEFNFVLFKVLYNESINLVIKEMNYKVQSACFFFFA